MAASNSIATETGCTSLAVAISELAMQNKIGCKISLEKVPGEKLSDDRILFSESHSRYILVVEQKNLKQIQSFLDRKTISYNVIGKFSSDQIVFQKNSSDVIKLSVDKAQKSWIRSLGELVVHG